jgi:hypothetical protein
LSFDGDPSINAYPIAGSSGGHNAGVAEDVSGGGVTDLLYRGGGPDLGLRNFLAGHTGSEMRQTEEVSRLSTVYTLLR